MFKDAGSSDSISRNLFERLLLQRVDVVRLPCGLFAA